MPRSLIVPAILIGGAGTRLWPLSRGNMPKQFLCLVGENSLFQDTVLRFDADGFANPWLLTNAETLHHAERQLAELDKYATGVVVEPLMRGTAAALAALALVIAERDDDALVLAAPADHVIEDAEAFRAVALRAAPLAAAGRIVTFGIRPTAPETGFGYIKGAIPLLVDGRPAGFAIDRGGFLEKPSRDRAEAFISRGYLWNAGIFLFKASSLIAEFRRHAPATLSAAQNAVEAASIDKRGAALLWHLDATAFGAAPADLSIDNAVMEVTDKAAVVPCEAIGWSDVGSLSALWEIGRQSANGNVIEGDALCLETHGSLIYARGDRKVVTSHVSDLIVIDTADCVVVIPREKAQEVRTIVKALKLTASPEINTSREDLFDWGRMRIIGRQPDSVTVELDLRPETAFGPRILRSDIENWFVCGGAVRATVNGSAVHLTCGASITLRRGDEVTMTGATDGASCVAVFAGSGPLSLHELASIDRTLPSHPGAASFPLAAAE